MTQKISPLVESFKENPYGDKYLYSINRSCFLSKSAHDIYQSHFKESLAKPEKFYLISGTDSGLLLNYVAQQPIPQNSRYLFIEKAELIDEISERYNLTADNTNIKICTIEDWANVAQEMDIIAYIYKISVELTRSFAAIDLHDIYYFNTTQTLKKELEAQIFTIHSSLGNHKFIERQMENISENQFPAINLQGKFSGKTAVILAGGPSLDENIDWVKDNRDNLLIIAVSRIAKKLIQEQVTPHIICSVDPYDISYEVSREMLLMGEQPIFIHTSNTQSGLLSQWQGKSLYLGNLLPWENELETKNFKGTGPTVTNTAITVAVELGIESILLAGVDLCFTQQGVSHASGSVEADVTGANLAFMGEWVTTVQGEQAQTTIQYAHAATMMSAQAKLAKEHGISIYNLSTHAIAMDYIEHQPTSNLQLTPENENLFDKIHELVPDFSVSNATRFNKALLEVITKTIKQVREVKKLAEQALEHNKSLYRDKDKESENFSHKISMDKIEKKFDLRYKKITKFIKSFGIQYFVKCIQPSGSEEWDNDKLEEIGNVYYQAYCKSSDMVLDILLKSEQRLQARLMELHKKPDMAICLAQWQLDNQLGRAQIWISRFENEFEQLPSAEKDRLHMLKSEFEQSFTKATKYQAKSEKQSPIAGIRKKIYILFKQGDTHALQQLVFGLRDLAEKNDQAVPLFYLAQSFLLCAIDQYQDALMAFEELNAEDLQEDDLRQLAHIALKLKQPELAETILESLSHLDKSYFPQFARVLKINGKTAQAIDIYTQYLESNNNDIFNWIALGQLYQSISVFDAAKLAFETVISMQPDNQTAKKHLNELNAL